MEELKKIGEELRISAKVQESSTKQLNFVVNDFLSLAQLNNGKFRKDCSNFNVKETIAEVMMI